MLTDPAESLQRAIVAALAADAATVALVADRVFDGVPEDAEFPYLSFGPSSMIADLAEQTDAAETSLQLDIWSRAPGFVEAKRIGAAVVAALHDARPAIACGSVQSLLLESARYLRDPDGLTSHGILTFTILTDANA